jgi:hypothetical protein
MKLDRLCSKVRIGKHLSDNFPIQNGLKQGDAFSPLLFNLVLGYVITKVQKNKLRLKSNGSHQLLVYVDDVNILGDNLDTTGGFSRRAQRHALVSYIYNLSH